MSYTYNEQPTWNTKCIVFTMVLATGYWFLPPQNKWILLLLMYFPYLVLAWYDYSYQCKRAMGPTYLSIFYAWFKPQASKQIQDFLNWNPVIRNKVLVVDCVVLSLVLLLTPAFLRWRP